MAFILCGRYPYLASGARMRQAACSSAKPLDDCPWLRHNGSMRCAFLLPLAVSACASFPELDAARSADVAAAPYPALLPLEQVLDAPPPRATREALEDVEARAAALLRRAAGLRARPVIEPPIRARMQRGVARPPGSG